MGKSRRNPVTDEQIISSYRETFSAYKTADALGIGSTTVERVLMKFKEPRPGLAMYRLRSIKYRGVERQMREMYEAGATLAQVRGKFGRDGDSDYAVKEALKRAGTALRDNPAPLVRPEEIERVRELNASGMGQKMISLEIGRSQSFVGRLMRNNGIATRGNIGPDSASWKGGRYVDASGYVRAWVAPDDPFRCMALNTGHVLEHRLVMARKLDRPLLRTESVHHIDGNRQNNAPDNLQLRQGKHGKHVVMCCLDCGSHNVGHVCLAG
jgi:hypothetical protein